MPARPQKSVTLGVNITLVIVMVPAHFHDVDGDLSDHIVGKIFGLSQILTVVL